MATASPDRQTLNEHSPERNISIEVSQKEGRNRLLASRSNSQSFSKFEPSTSISQSKSQRLVLHSNRNYQENSNASRRYPPDSGRDRTRHNSSRTKNEDSFSDYCNYVLSSSKRSTTPELERDKIQEDYDSKLILERRNIEEASRAFWEKRIKEISRAYQEKIEEVANF